VLITTPPAAPLGQLIQDLLSDKNKLIDYAITVQSTQKCYEDSLKKK